MSPDQEPGTRRVDVRRAVRQFECFMRTVNPGFRADAPGEERMTSDEYAE